MIQIQSTIHLRFTSKKSASPNQRIQDNLSKFQEKLKQYQVFVLIFLFLIYFQVYCKSNNQKFTVDLLRSNMNFYNFICIGAQMRISDQNIQLMESLLRLKYTNIIINTLPLLIRTRFIQTNWTFHSQDFRCLVTINNVLSYVFKPDFDPDSSFFSLSRFRINGDKVKF